MLATVTKSIVMKIQSGHAKFLESLRLTAANSTWGYMETYAVPLGACSHQTGPLSGSQTAEAATFWAENHNQHAHQCWIHPPDLVPSPLGRSPSAGTP